MQNCSSCPDFNEEEAPTKETCQHELRQLEHNALEAVLHAFRAQGPLDLYKEVLLDHLKTALCISQEDYIFKVDQVATNPKLKTICDTVNPAYANTEANWLLERQSVLPCDYKQHMNRLGRDVTDIFDPSQISNETWQKMYKDQEEKKKLSLLKLLKCKNSINVVEEIEDGKQEVVETPNPSMFALDLQIKDAVPFNLFVKERLAFSRQIKKRSRSSKSQTIDGKNDINY